MQRLAAEHPDKTVFSLDPLICPCSTMFRIDAAHLAWVLEGLVEGEVRNRITVDDDTAAWAGWRWSACWRSPDGENPTAPANDATAFSFSTRPPPPGGLPGGRAA